MIISLDEVGFDFIKEQEGLVLHPYLDQVGITTIGYGSTYYEDGTHVKITDPAITLERARDLFHTTSAQYIHAVACWTKPVLNQNQFNALFSLCYNIGTGGFRRSTVLSLINQDITDERLKDAFLMWDKAQGNELQDLKKRREKEYNLYIS